jgi:hypothetical protein
MLRSTTGGSLPSSTRGCWRPSASTVSSSPFFARRSRPIRLHPRRESACSRFSPRSELRSLPAPRSRAGSSCARHDRAPGTGFASISCSGPLPPKPSRSTAWCSASSERPCHRCLLSSHSGSRPCSSAPREKPHGQRRRAGSNGEGREGLTDSTRTSSNRITAADSRLSLWNPVAPF